ncbi:MAG: hypothetical protein ACLP2Y_11920, partial [Limisphaerales bacterium]
RSAAVSQTSRSGCARPAGGISLRLWGFQLLRLVLRTQPRSSRFAIGGSVKMRPKTEQTARQNPRQTPDVRSVRNKKARPDWPG